MQITPIPIALDPNATYEFWLPEWNDILAEYRPTLVARHMTARQAVDAGRELSAAEHDSGEAVLARFCSFISKSLVAWRNVLDANGEPIPFGAKPIDEVFTYGQILRMVEAMSAAARLSEDQRKN